MARGLKGRQGSPTRLRATRLRTAPAGSRQPFARQLGVAGLATLAVVGMLAALQARPGAPEAGAKPGAAAPAPAVQAKLHANPVSASPPEQAMLAEPARPGPDPAPADPAPTSPTPARPAVQVAAAPVSAAAPVNPAPEALPSPRPPAATLGEAIARGSVKPDPAAPTECLPAEFKALLGELSTRFGPVKVVSTTQLHTDNHSPGSVRARMHQACRAVDLKVEGDRQAALRYLRGRPEVSGLNTYRNDLIHIDYAERRHSARARAGSGSAE